MSAPVLRIVEEIERIATDQWFDLDGVEAPVCDCGERCPDESDGEYLRLGERAYCSRECLALDLLWRWHPRQDQSPASVRRVEQMIESSFAAARAKAVRPEYDYGRKLDGSWIERYDLERAAERHGYDGWSHVVDVSQPTADRILAELRGES